jgi:hypothetical protein
MSYGAGLKYARMFTREAPLGEHTEEVVTAALSITLSDLYGCSSVSVREATVKSSPVVYT